MNICLFILSNLFVLTAAGMLSEMWFGKQDIRVRFLGFLVLFSVVVTFIELLAGLAGHLTAMTATLMAAAVFLGTWVTRMCISRREPVYSMTPAYLVILLALLISGLGVGVLGGQYFTHGTRFCQDDLTYHATVAAHWYLEKDISAGPMNYHYYVPMNAELFSLWFLLPFGQDGMVFLAGYYWLCVVIAAAAVLFKQMNISPRWLGLALLCFCCAKDVYAQALHTFTAVDLSGPAMVIAAIAFLNSLGLEPAIKRWSCILIAGLCAGFAYGTKVPFTTVCLLFCFWIFFSVPDRFSRRLGYVMLFGLVSLFAGSFWYIRDLVLTANPVFPGQLGPLSGPITRDMQYQTSVVGRLILSGFDSGVIRDMIIAHVSWPYGLFLVAFAGIAAGMCRLWKPSGSRRTIILILLTVFVMIATYIHMPFSAANNDPDSPLVINLRFVIGPFLLGVILFFLLLETKAPWKIIWLLFCCAGIVISYVRHSNSAMLPLLAAALLWYLIYPYLQQQKRFVSLSGITVFIAAMLAGLAFVFPTLQKKADDNLLASHAFRKGISNAWKIVNTLPPRSRIIVSGYLGYCYYPLFGRQYQNQPWYYTHAYQSHIPLHIRWKDNPEDSAFWKKYAYSPEPWVQTLSVLDIEYILFYQSLSGAWPQTRDTLIQLNMADPVDSGENWALWKIKK